MSRILVITCFFIVIISTAQNQSSFTIYESQEYIDEIKTDSIQSIYTSKQGNTAVIRSNKKYFFYDIFDSDLNRLYSKSEKINRKEYSIGDIFYNEEVKVFTESYPEKDEKTIWCQTLNIETKALKKIQLTTTKVDKRLSLYSNKKGAKFAITPNQKYLSIVSYTVNKGEINLHVIVFDSKTFDIIFEKQITRNESKFYAISDLHIDNDQNLYLLGESYYKEDTPNSKKDENHYYLLEKISKTNYKTLKIKFKDKYIKKLKASMFDDKYTLYGLYSEKDLGKIKGVCTVSVDLKTMEAKNNYFQELPPQVIIDLYGKEKSERKKKKELSNFKINYILTDSQNNIYFLAEEFYITSASAGPYGGSTSTPHYDDILILKFNKEGTLDWGRSIYKTATKSAYNAFLKNDKLHVLLNTGKDLKKLKDGRTKSTKGLFETSALYDYSFTDDGKITIDKIQNNKNKTYYLPKYGNFVDGKFIMISDSSINRKFMKLE